jgi:hypothetical protein
MRRYGLALVTLMCISFVLVPFNTLHAHVSADHDHTLVHGGHGHDVAVDDSAHEIGEGDHVVHAHFAATDGGATFTWVHWLPLLGALGLLLLFLPRVVRSPRPQRLDDWPAHRRGHWRPPLRGPPLNSH